LLVTEWRKWGPARYISKIFRKKKSIKIMTPGITGIMGSDSNPHDMPEQQQWLGQCEKLLSEMKEGNLKKSLGTIQSLLVRNSLLIKEMNEMPGAEERDQRTVETRAVYTMEMRSNMIELARLTAELEILPGIKVSEEGAAPV
jgi:hypothetical protein